jgi:2-oxoglutarate ferredoxin oxidoreductase subunit gamma
VIVADQGLRSVPILESAWSAVVMHGRYWPGVAARIRPEGLVVYNSSVAGDLSPGDLTAVPVAAGEIADGIGAPMAAGFVLLGAFAGVTGLVSTDALVEAMRDLVPPYRVQHIENNEKAIRAGASSVTALSEPAWAVTPA